MNSMQISFYKNRARIVEAMGKQQKVCKGYVEEQEDSVNYIKVV